MDRNYLFYYLHTFQKEIRNLSLRHNSFKKPSQVEKNKAIPDKEQLYLNCLGLLTTCTINRNSDNRTGTSNK